MSRTKPTITRKTKNQKNVMIPRGMEEIGVQAGAIAKSTILVGDFILLFQLLIKQVDRKLAEIQKT